MGGEEGWCYHYIRADEEVLCVRLDEEDGEVFREATIIPMDVSPEIIRIEFGGNLVWAESLVFENNACFELLEAWEKEDKERCETLTGVKQSWWKIEKEEEGWGRNRSRGGDGVLEDGR